MISVIGDLWNFQLGNNLRHIRCITTNLTVRQDGKLVMGKGCALQARMRFVGIDDRLGKLVSSGNVGIILLDDLGLLVFPTKRNYYEKADINLIRKSAKELTNMATQRQDCVFILPRPGCGLGALDWHNEVKPVIEKILPDNVLAISQEG